MTGCYLQTVNPNFFHSNLRFLNAKIGDLRTVIQQNDVDVVAITET